MDKKYTVSDYGYITINLGILGSQTSPIEIYETVPDLTQYGEGNEGFSLRPMVELKAYNANFQ